MKKFRADTIRLKFLKIFAAAVRIFVSFMKHLKILID